MYYNINEKNNEIVLNKFFKKLEIFSSYNLDYIPQDKIKMEVFLWTIE